jgi:hypothetical protein
MSLLQEMQSKGMADCQFNRQFLNTREFLILEYLDFKNNYLTPALFAEHRGMTEAEGQALIDLGRSLFNSDNIHK